MRRNLTDQVSIQFLEAEVESGFALVDEARAFRAADQIPFSERALREANEIAADIERRLLRLATAEADAFTPLVAELRNEISATQRERL